MTEGRLPSIGVAGNDVTETLPVKVATRGTDISSGEEALNSRVLRVGVVASDMHGRWLYEAALEEASEQHVVVFAGSTALPATLVRDSGRLKLLVLWQGASEPTERERSTG